MKLLLLASMFFGLAGAQEEIRKPGPIPGGGAEDLLGNTKFHPDQIKANQADTLRRSADCAEGNRGKNAKVSSRYHLCRVKPMKTPNSAQRDTHSQKPEKVPKNGLVPKSQSD